jgi:hypothetical protein
MKLHFFEVLFGSNLSTYQKVEISFFSVFGYEEITCSVLQSQWKYGKDGQSLG